MAGRYAIGIDFGTLSARAVLVDTSDGRVAATATSAFSHGVIQEVFPPTGESLPAAWCLQDPDDYVTALESTVKSMMSESGVSKENVIGISIDFTACTLVPLDKNAVPLCQIPKFKNRPHAYVKLWKHHAAQPYADEINEKLASFPNDVADYYGKRISPEITLPKLLQILREDAELYTEMDCICEASDWINRLLTGELRRSASTAGYKSMYFNEKGYPDDSFFTRIDPGLKGVMRTKLRGGVCGITKPFGSLNREWAEKLGLREGICVGCGIIDAHAGVAGSGIFRPGQMMMALGTSSVQAVLNTRAYSGSGVIGAIRDAVIPGYYLWETGLAAVGDLLSAYASQVSDSPDALERLTKGAARLYPGENGLLALDWWNGNKTPFVDGNLSGVIAGLRLGTRPEEIFRALIESTAFGSKVIMDEFENAGTKIDEIIACGGIVDKNPLLMQIYADVLGYDIQIAGCEQTMALGAAIYASVAAGKAAGGHDTIEQAVAAMTHLKKQVFKPDKANFPVYMKLYGEYRRLSGRFGGELAQTLHNLLGLMETSKRLHQS